MNRLALCVGTAANASDEVATALRLGDFDSFYVCNWAGVHWKGPFFWWCSLTPQDFRGELLREREARGLPTTNFITVGPSFDGPVWSPRRDPVQRRAGQRWGITYSYRDRFGGNFNVPFTPSGGLLAVEAALEDGCDRIVLAGMPMDGRAGMLRPGICSASRYDHSLAHWQHELPHLQGRVKSLSGRTREWLGEPTPEWLAEPCCGEGDPAPPSPPT